MPDNDIDAIKRDLHDGFDRMIENLQAARDAIDTPELFPAPATERNLAEGYRYVLGFLLGSIERALSDPLYPRFRRAIQPMNRSTIDNSDAVYLGAEIDGNYSYTIRCKGLDSRHWRGEAPVEGLRAPQYVIFELASSYAGDSGGLAMAASARSARSRHMAASSCRAASWSRRVALSFDATRS